MKTKVTITMSVLTPSTVQEINGCEEPGAVGEEGGGIHLCVHMLASARI